MEENKSEHPFIELLCGVSHSGKSTFVKSMYGQRFKGIVLSRDDLVMKYGKGLTYNECWNSLTKDLHRMIDDELEEKFDEAVELSVNIVMDLMNLTKRQRTRWLVDLPIKYKKRARVFEVPFHTILERNDLLLSKKHIPNDRLRDMLNRFEIPTLGEFDEVIINNNITHKELIIN